MISHRSRRSWSWRRSRTGGAATVGAVAAIAVTFLLVAMPAGAARPVTVFAAVSTANAMEAVVRSYLVRGGSPVRTVFAASSTLARQIVQGAPADLYLCANAAWMDEAVRQGAIEAGSRVDLLGNRLVLIAAKGVDLDLRVAPGFALAEALGSRRIALGDPAHVPAGIYARAALSQLGVWDRVAPKAAFAGNSRAALALVERGEAAAGIVYASDAAIGARVRVVATFPATAHAPIVYPLAVVAGRRTAAVAAFYRYLQGSEADAIFQAHGFTPPVRGGRAVGAGP